MRAIYDLTKYPTTYDFAGWCCIARTSGAEHVHFVVDGPIAHWKYPQDVAWKRFATILLPMTKLAGLTFSVGAREDGPEFSYHGGHVNQMYLKEGRIVKLAPTMKTTRRGYTTITLRDSFRNKHRNSNKEAWEKFAKYLSGKNVDVMIIPEAEDNIINLEHRMAWYSGADMNMGVAQGPLALCVFSEAPYISINQNPVDKTGTAQYDVTRLLEKTGFPVGGQFAFRNERQILVWEPDEYENIVRAWNAMQEGKFKVAA